MSKRLEVTLGKTGITLQNPIMSASGCFGFGREAAAIYDLDVLGGYIVKSTTLEPRVGNDVIRIAETPSGMLNAIGLQNPGVRKIVETELPWLSQTFNQPIFVNLAGSSINDYVETAKILSHSPHLNAVELNISCPNVKEGGIQFGTDPAVAAELTAAIKAESNVPVFVKLSPNVTSITDMAKAVVAAGADGLSLINTLVGMRLDPKTGKPILANKTGGFSGPAILPVAVRAIYEVASVVDVPIIGMGGVSTPADVVELMSAGATAVAVGSATFPNPFAMPEIIEALPEYLDSLGVENVSEIIGRAHK